MSAQQGTIEEYYNSESESDGEVENDPEYEEDSDIEIETNKKPKIIIGGALSDDEEEEAEQGEMEADADAESVKTDESDDEEVHEDVVTEKLLKKPTTTLVYADEEDDDDDVDDDENYLQKFDRDINDDYILNFHPECKTHNYDEISALTKVVYNDSGIIVDPLHRTIPILTKYERTRILGQRAKQINSGSRPFVKVPENIIDGYLIAEIELAQKRIPFIVRRPFPNGGCEYWNLKDLELVD